LLEERCTLRTLYRDLEQLPAAGFPVYQEDGKFKCRLGESAALRAMPLRPSEVLSLLVAEDLLPAIDSQLTSAHRELRVRLAAQLTDVGRAWVREQRELLRATLPAPAALKGHAAILDVIDDALSQEQVLRLRYAAPGKEPTDRDVEPHLLWLHAGCPYLVAYCLRADAFRTFAVQRIVSATLLDKAFDRRVDFDAQGFTEQSFGVFQGEAVDIAIAFYPGVAHVARERLWHPSARVEDLPGGGVCLHMHAGGLPEIAAWVAGFGGKAQALAPPALVAQVRALHRAGLERYETEPPDAL